MAITDAKHVVRVRDLLAILLLEGGVMDVRAQDEAVLVYLRSFVGEEANASGEGEFGDDVAREGGAAWFDRLFLVGAVLEA